MKNIKYPLNIYLISKYKPILNVLTGIVDSDIAIANNRYRLPFYTVSATLPHYEKLFISTKTEIRNHIAGVGLTFEEAFTKLIGEIVERYSLIAGFQKHMKNVEYYTYRELERKGEDVIPFEYLVLYTDYQYSLTGLYKPTKEMALGWIKCPSLLYPKKEIYVPAQIFMGYQLHNNEKLILISTSNGAAAHTDIKSALTHAILEYIERNNFMIKWYTLTPSPEISVDNEELNNIIKNSSYNIKFVDFFLPDMPVHTVGAFIKNRYNKFPYILFGLRASLNPLYAIYGALAEAASGLAYADFAIGRFINNVDSIINDKTLFLDLDSNVARWLLPTEISRKNNILNQLIQGKINLSDISNGKNYISIEDQIYELISYLRKISKYSTFLDITSPEIAELGFSVVKVYIPELVDLALPSLPPSKHPLLVKYGGVKNEYPHLLP
ncbi:YcaO-like family protein [Sulfolobus sp. S-194]|uniref:YcaO-like family protein n=1 Tax=Sulfolobus sp. S-194 TaxID=2512240 RepID=UPI00143A5929|nr:YcaO-like family protein [Sulfolobus sp. S-194]